MFLVFRLYGKFCWPPTPQLLDEKAQASGIVEVYAAQKPGANEHTALLRWFPTDQESDPPPPDPKAAYDSLFDLSSQHAAEWFGERTNEPSAIWLDGSAPAATDTAPAWVMFRGAFLFEQYQRRDLEKAAPGPSDLEVQWPLMRRFTYGDNPVFSSLGIYRRSRSLLHLSLHLPLPVRRTSHSAASRKNAGAFPFSAVFDLKPKAANDWFAIDRLIAGWKEKDDLPKLDKAETSCFPFLGEKQPKPMQLGSFGFSEYGKTGGNFAVFGLDRETSLKYWPLNSQALRQDILWPYGFSLDYDGPDWLKSANIGLADSSLRFSRPTDGTGANRGHTSSLIYRASVVKRGNNAPTSDDLQGDSAGFRLRLARELGGRLAQGIHYGVDESANEEKASKVDGWLTIVAKILSVDCELSWEISRRDIWTDNRDVDWSPTVSIRLHWLEPISAHNVRAAAVSTAGFRSGLLAHANHSFAKTRDSLELGETGRPPSFLPALSGPDHNPSIRFSLYGSPLPASFKDGVLLWGRPVPGPKGRHEGWRRPSMRLSIASDRHLIEGTKETEYRSEKKDQINNFKLQLSAAGLTFFQPRTTAPELELTLTHDSGWPQQAIDSVEDGEPFFASFELVARPKLKDEDSWYGRLSSLQFRGSGIFPVARQPGHLRVGGRGARLGLGDGSPTLLYPEGRIAAEISLAIPAAAVEPVGVDTERTDRSGRPGPLLIPLDAQAPGSASENAFWLKTTETLSPTHDRKLVASIIENSPQTGTRSYVVLSSEPFSIFRYTHQPLYARGQVDTANVAFYSGDDRIWQYRRTSDLYHYVFPPQAIGESADKPRRLELHDLPVPDPNKEDPPLPFVRTLDEHGKLKPSIDLQRRVVEYRLTPSAEMWIQPSDVERGYFMPEATSYEIFRQHGEYGLGAALRYLRAEFLYGLPVGIDVSKERSIARGARVAEIEALTGKPTGPARADAEPRIAGRWNALRSAIARRPERLEIWARDLDSAVDFTPARFADGVQFVLRHSALHRPPLIDLKPNNEVVIQEGENDYKGLPRIAGLAGDKVPAELENNPRHHPQGLSGGALWPVEQLNLFKSLLQAPQSTGGTIESIALSPIGGDARQKAEFLNGKVTIISETYNGYVQRQQVEVLGRICAFWHRAKHVVVYERTVNPSAQFAPKYEEDRHHTRSRRPILRKVREYIELLQPERNYPDFTTAAQRSAGFLEGVRFNSKIINVDSAWARDISEFGWEIPLWNRQSARERPQVYPMPDVAFVSTADGDAEKPVVAQECLDPDYLYFFADVSTATSADTDTWKSLLSLDFPNMPVAHDLALKVDVKSSEQPGPSEHEKRRPPVSRILPGLRRFTWRLAPAAQKVAVNAGRAGKPVYAGLDSVTFMRATHATGVPKELSKDHTLSKVLGIVDDFTKKGPESETLAPLKYWGSDGQNASFASAKAFSDGIAALNKELASEAPNLSALNQARKNLSSVWKGSIKDDLKKLIPTDVAKFQAFASGLEAAPSLCEKLKSDAVETIQRKELLVRSALQDWGMQAEAILNEIEPYKNQATKEQAVDALTNSAVDYIRPIFEEASKDVTRLQEGVEKSSAILIDIEAEIDAIIERARQRIAQFVHGYDQSKPWSEERRRSFRLGLTAAVSSIGEDIVAAIEEARQRLGVELNEVSQAIGGHIAKALGQLTVLQSGALDNITTVHRHVDRLLGKIDGILERFVNTAGGGELDTILAKVEGNGSVSQDLKDTAKKVIDDLKAAIVNAKAAAVKARAQAATVDQRADDAVSQIKTSITALGDALKAIGEAVSADLVKLTGIATDLVNENANDLANEVNGLVGVVNTEITKLTAWPDRWLVNIGSQIDAVVVPVTTFLDSLLADIKIELRKIPAAALPVIDDARNVLQSVQDALGPNALLKTFVQDQIVRKALQQLLDPLPEKIDDIVEIGKAVTTIRVQLGVLAETVGDLMRNLKNGALGALDQVSAACGQIAEGVAEVEKYFQSIGSQAVAYFDSKLNDAYTALTKEFGDLDQDLASFPGNAKDLIKAAQSFDRSVRGLQNDLSRAHETARAYGDRVFDRFSKLDDGGLLAAPSNILKLYSAVTGAPELAALKADIDRIRSDFDEIDNIIRTTQANALFNRLSDELKALGLSLPFDKIGDRLLPANLSNFEIGNVFRNFGGAKLSNLLKGYKIPAGVSDAVRVTHDFDKKQARAWVQVDIDAPMGGRRSLFSVGVFKADFVDMHLTGQVRLEADQDKVSESGYGRVGTTVDLVVGGQSMVRFEKFGLSFTREKGLDVEFDPKNIRLNPSFKFIQDFLSTLFPDDIGGLEIIKQNGIPVGLQHDFSIPPLALNFGTSGVSNICIGNHFKLLAFPDFMLANRFNLSSVERPFIFSIFIIGGTGYIQIDAEYRPFDNELTVCVEAGAGGSASLAFAFGPFSGQVFITLSGTLAYRKVIGKPGGGLSISAVLVIAGHVNVAGIVTVGIVLMLRMTYRDNGQIDADGSLTVVIRISKFFKITARANATYKLRGGKSETTVSTGVSGEVTDEKLNKLKKAADKLEGARH